MVIKAVNHFIQIMVGCKFDCISQIIRDPCAKKCNIICIVFFAP